jgi:hypothetical protein
MAAIIRNAGRRLTAGVPAALEPAGPEFSPVECRCRKGRGRDIAGGLASRRDGGRAVKWHSLDCTCDPGIVRLSSILVKSLPGRGRVGACSGELKPIDLDRRQRAVPSRCDDRYERVQVVAWPWRFWCRRSTSRFGRRRSGLAVTIHGSNRRRWRATSAFRRRSRQAMGRLSPVASPKLQDRRFHPAQGAGAHRLQRPRRIRHRLPRCGWTFFARSVKTLILPPRPPSESRA